jgi:Restriction endonuclease/NACHT domain
MTWQQFETQVVELFRLLGYQVQADTRVQGAQTDLFARSPHRFKPNLLVECKYHDSLTAKVSIDEIENFSARIIRLRAEGVVDQGYLVTNTGFTSHAKGSLFDSTSGKFVFLATYNELLHQLMDTDFYLSNYVRQYKESGSFERFVDLWVLDPCQIQRLKFDAAPGIAFKVDIGSEENPNAFLEVQPTSVLKARSVSREKGSENHIDCLLLPVTKYVDLFLANKDQRLSILLGDFGCGKTTSLRHIMYLLAERKLASANNVDVPVPLLVSLRNYNKVVDFDALFTTFLNHEVGLDRVNLALFNRLNELGHFVLLLDGFDEMARLVTATERRLTFAEICKLTTKRNKVLVSGRAGYFPELGEIGEVLRNLRSGPSSSVRSLGNTKIPMEATLGCMQLMDQNQRKQYLKNSVNAHVGSSRIKLSRAVDNLLELGVVADLARRPVLTNMIVESASDLRDMKPDQINMRSLYETYTNKWMRREESKGFFRLLIDSDKKETFVALLALEMHSRDSLKIHYGALNDSIHQHFNLEKEVELEHFSHDIRTCSFLSYDDLGHYQFTHKSFMEFFVAREFVKFQRSIHHGAFTQPLTKEMVDFVEPGDFPIEARKLWLFGELINLLKEVAVWEQDFELAAAYRDKGDIWRKRGLGEQLAKNWPDYRPAAVALQIEAWIEEIAAILPDTRKTVPEWASFTSVKSFGEKPVLEWADFASVKWLGEDFWRKLRARLS